MAGRSDYYGTFLESLRANTAPTAAQAGNLDALLARLREAAPAGVPLKDLVAAAGNSVDNAAAGLNRLRELGIIAGGPEGYTLTPAGLDLAGSIGG